jgi:hypothetical protein
MNPIEFLKEKKYKDYYQSHYLESVATLLPKVFGYEESEKLLRNSKSIKNQRERKKLLKSIYHIEKNKIDINGLGMMDIFLRDLSDAQDFRKYYSDILVNYKTNSRILSYFSKNKDIELDKESEARTFKNFLENSLPEDQQFKTIIPKSTVVKPVDLNEEIIKQIHLEENKESIITVDNKRYRLKNLKTRKELKEKSCFYECCWHSTYGSYFDYKGFIDVFNEADKNIGTIRYKESTISGTIEMAMWLNPELNKDNELYFELNDNGLKKVAKEMDKLIGDDNKKLKSENLMFRPHYGNIEKQLSIIPSYKENQKIKIKANNG